LERQLYSFYQREIPGHQIAVKVRLYVFRGFKPFTSDQNDYKLWPLHSFFNGQHLNPGSGRLVDEIV